MNSTLDWLRPYTVPRALLVSLLFVIGVAFRVTALLPALAVHVCDRAADRVVRWADAVPPVPVRTITQPTGSRGRTQR